MYVKGGKPLHGILRFEAIVEESRIEPILTPKLQI